MITMNTKGLMAGMVLAVMILTTTGAALDAPFNAAFSTVYGQVTDGGAGVNGAAVSLAANGVTITTVTMTNNRGEHGFYIFELANIPRVTDTTPLTLSVTSGTKTATTTITRGGSNLQKIDLAVQAVQTPVLATISVIPSTKSVIEGATSNFTADTRDQFGAPIDTVVTWSSSNSTVGTIDAAGVFTAKVAGTAVITAANGGVSGTATVTVVSAAPVLTTITVAPAFTLAPVGGTRNFTAATLDQFRNPITATVTWSSSNSTVGTIDAAGVFTAKVEGTSTITAASGTVSGTATVTVIIPALTTITVTPEFVSVVVGGTQTFTAKTLDDFGNPIVATVTWNSSNTTVGTVNAATGVFTANAEGVTTITAASGGVSGTATVTVTVTVPITVAIEVRDNINPRAQGVIRVAILNNTPPTPPGFDVATIDIPTVRFGPDGATVVKNVTEGNNNLLLHFNVQDTGIECGDAQVTLTGKTKSGQDIIGTVSIVTVGCEDNRGRGGGGGSGGGGVTTDEPYENIGKSERHEKALIANAPVTYNFDAPEHEVEQIVVTGSENENDIALRVEVLKGTAKLVTAAPPGTVYKNLNIIAGTKRIKKAAIKFKVENTWMQNNNLAGSDMKMLRWNGGKWVELETKETNKDSTHTHFEATTEGFSHFAIIGTKGETMPAALPEVNPPEITPSVTATATAVSPEVSPPINLAVVAVAVLIAIVVVLYIRRR